MNMRHSLTFLPNGEISEELLHRHQKVKLEIEFCVGHILSQFQPREAFALAQDAH
jgi:hypothetical protein